MSDSVLPKSTRFSDEVAYIAPMISFLLLIWVGTQSKNLYVPSYIARGTVAGVLLIYFRRQYTKIRWSHWWLGIVVGALGLVQWVGMQAGLEKLHEIFRPGEDVFNPMSYFEGRPGLMWAFIAFRWIVSASIVVPFMEELFWRDYLWRTIVAPNDFKLAKVGEMDWKAFCVVAVAFCFVHGNWALTAVVWGAMEGALLVYTRSLGACIIAHATTNFLLGAYVLYTKNWSLW